jgi:hypothetical protein
MEEIIYNYHSEMNSVIFNKWVEEQLVPALPPKSLVVMDEASYHSVIKPSFTSCI